MFDNWYGFGLVDATAAVNMAENDSNHLAGPMVDNTASETVNQEVPVGTATGLNVPLTVSGSAQTVEYVQVSIDLSFVSSLSDLAVEVVSPSGTRSVLQNAFNGFENRHDVSDWLLSSNAFNGESAQGPWTIKLIDVNSRGDGTEFEAIPTILSHVTLNVLGH
jgi:subtilisin-like proprotein convertase family protein